jgi:hypothetical protein
LRELSDIAVKANVTAIDILNGRITEAFDELKSMFAEPFALNSVAPTEVLGEHVAMVEHAASVGDVVGQDEPETTVKIRTRKKAAPAAKVPRTSAGADSRVRRNPLGVDCRPNGGR